MQKVRVKGHMRVKVDVEAAFSIPLGQIAFLNMMMMIE